VDTGRNKVKEAEEKIKTYSEQKQQLVVRLEIEAREIKALKYELEVKHIARFFISDFVDLLRDWCVIIIYCWLCI